MTTSVGKALLVPSDFTFVGSYTFSADNQAAYGRGLTFRRVNGQMRFLTFRYSGVWKPPTPAAQLIEFALPEKVGQKITTLTGRWNDIWSPAPSPNVGNGDQYGLWWEDQGDEKGRLWTTHSANYPSDPKPAGSLTGTNNPFAVAVRTLEPESKVSDVKGDYGFAEVGQRAIYGGFQPIPKWFRDKYGISQPYAVGWGGTAARMGQGLVPSLGLMVVAIPDVTRYRPGSVIPARDFRILADHRSGAKHGEDWYKTGRPTAFDRGARNADVINYFDSGDRRPNPSTPPTVPPAPGAHWLSPAPDGWGRFVWYDSYYGTGCWIDGPRKVGFVAIGNFARGKAYYARSTLHNEGRHAELHVFNPDDFGKVLQGKKNPWNVQPAAAKLLTRDLAPLGLLWPDDGNSSMGGPAAAVFDPTTRHLYIWCTSVNRKYECVLVVYKVNC